MTFPSHRGGYVAAFTVALSTLALISTAPAHAGASERTTFLLSRAADGGFPNGDSRNPDVSHDQRIARVMAYESDASNIVNGDVNNTTDVFIVRRQGPWGQHGTSWNMGGDRARVEGHGRRPGQRALDPAGARRRRASRPELRRVRLGGTNLVPGDTNGRPTSSSARSRAARSPACPWTPAASRATARATTSPSTATASRSRSAPTPRTSVAGAATSRSTCTSCRRRATTRSSTARRSSPRPRPRAPRATEIRGSRNTPAPARRSCSPRWPRTWPVATPTASRTCTSGR